jgi:hypothetical protein
MCISRWNWILCVGNTTSNVVELPLKADPRPLNLGEEWHEDLPSVYVFNSPKQSKDLAMFGNVGFHYNPNGNYKNPNIQILGS